MENKLLNKIGLNNIYKLKLPRDTLDSIVKSVTEHVSRIYNKYTDDNDDHIYDDVQLLDVEIFELINDLITDPNFEYDESFITNIVKTIQLIYADSIHIHNIIQKKKVDNITYNITNNSDEVSKLRQVIIQRDVDITNLHSNHKIITDNLENQIIILKSNISKYQSEIQILKNTVESLKKEYILKERKFNNDIKDLNKKVLDLLFKLQSCSDKSKEVVKLQHDLQTLQQQLQLSTKNNDDYKNQLLLLTDEMKLVKQQYKACIDENNKLIQAQSFHEINEEELKNNNDTIRELKLKNKELVDKLALLEKEVMSMGNKEDINKLHDNITELKTQNDTLLSKQQRLNEEKFNLQNENKKLNEIIEQNELHFNEERINLNEGIESYKKQLSEMKSVLDAKQRLLNDQKKNCNEQVKNLEHELSEKIRLQLSYDTKIEEYKNILLSRDDEIKAVKLAHEQDIKYYNNEKDLLILNNDKKMKEYKTKIQELTENIKKNDDNKFEYQNQLKKLQKTIEILNEKNTASQRAKADCEKNNMQLNEQIISHLDNIKILQRDIDLKDKQIHDYITTLHDIAEKIRTNEACSNIILGAI